MPITFSTRKILLWAVFFGLATQGCAPSSPYSWQLANNTKGVSNQIAPDSAMAALVAPYKMQLDSQMGVVIGQAPVEIPRDSDAYESRLGNFCADLMLSQANKMTKGAPADLSLVTVGGLRVPIAAGPVTTGKIYELMPFENELVILTVKGEHLASTFKRITERKGLAFSNMNLKLKGGVIASATIGGIPLDFNKEYRVVVSDYLASGGDYMEGLKLATQTEVLHLKVRDAIIAHIKELTAQDKLVTSVFEGRIVVEQ